MGRSKDPVAQAKIRRILIAVYQQERPGVFHVPNVQQPLEKRKKQERKVKL